MDAYRQAARDRWLAATAQSSAPNPLSSSSQVRSRQDNNSPDNPNIAATSPTHLSHVNKPPIDVNSIDLTAFEVPSNTAELVECAHERSMTCLTCMGRQTVSLGEAEEASMAAPSASGESSSTADASQRLFTFSMGSVHCSEAAMSRAAARVRAALAQAPLEHSHELSRQDKRVIVAQKRVGANERSLIYGEVRVWSFTRVLQLAVSRVHAVRGSEQPLVFYDLGSGVGKAVFTAASMFGAQVFAKTSGIEIMPRLHEQAVRALDVLHSLDGIDDLAPLPKVELLLGDIFELTHWCSEADVVFCATTGFDDALMARLDDAVASLSAGAVVLTFTNRLKAARAELLLSRKFRMSWGNVTVHVHQMS